MSDLKRTALTSVRRGRHRAAGRKARPLSWPRDGGVHALEVPTTGTSRKTLIRAWWCVAPHAADIGAWPIVPIARDDHPEQAAAVSCSKRDSVLAHLSTPRPD